MATFGKISKRHMRRKISNKAKFTLSNLMLHNSNNDTESYALNILNINNISSDTSNPESVRNTSLYSNNYNHSVLVSLESNHEQIHCINSVTKENNNYTESSLPLPANNKSGFRDLHSLEIHENIKTSEICNDNGNAYEQNFTNQLKQWAISNNITHKSLNELVFIIRDKYPFLKRDTRSILHTPHSVNTIKFDNGEMLYLGLLNSLLEKLKDGFIDVQNGNVIKLQINIDGIPIYKSSSQEFWPILARCTSFKNDSPFVVAIFCGAGKPGSLELYLEKFIAKSLELSERGFHYLNKNYVVEIEFFTCDAPARAYLKQVKGPTGKFGCERCHIETVYMEKRRFYPVQISSQVRRDSDFNEGEINGEHMKGKSPLLNLNVGLVSKFVLDPMHLIFLGVVRRLILIYWVEGKRPVKLPKSTISNIDTQIKNKRKYITNEFPRKMRCIKEVKQWKANEFRFFLLYFGPSLLRLNVASNIYRHFLLLHSAIFILSSEKFITKYIDHARSSLIKFVESAPKIYDKFFNVYNVHSLIHVCDDVQSYGSLCSYSCFGFENYLGKLKRLIRGKYRPLQQVNNRLREINNVYNNHLNRVDTYLKPLGVFEENFNYFHCRKLRISDKLIISTSCPDNVVAVGSNLCVIQSIICVDNIYKCIANKFRYKEDFYTFPLNSSKLGIYYAWGEGDQIIFKVSDNFVKYITFPYKNGFYCSPIVHQIM